MSTLQIAIIRLDFQPAENLDEETVLVYLHRLKSGAHIPPLTVRFDGENYFLQDGFHRLEASKRSSLQSVEADILPGTLEQMEAEFREDLKESLKLIRRTSGQ